jgi:hypothetical protein
VGDEEILLNSKKYYIGITPICQLLFHSNCDQAKDTRIACVLTPLKGQRKSPCKLFIRKGLKVGVADWNKLEPVFARKNLICRKKQHNQYYRIGSYTNFFSADRLN